MNRLQKILKLQLKDNEEAIESIVDNIISELEYYKKIEEKTISESEVNIQKTLANITNKEIEDVVPEIYSSFSKREDSINTLDRIERIKAYLFEEIQERKTIRGLKK